MAPIWIVPKLPLGHSLLFSFAFFELRMNICVERITCQQRFETNYHHFLWYIKDFLLHTTTIKITICKTLFSKHFLFISLEFWLSMGLITKTLCFANRLGARRLKRAKNNMQILPSYQFFIYWISYCKSSFWKTTI